MSVSYTFDAMGRLNAVTDNIAMQTIILGASYGPANELTSAASTPNTMRKFVLLRFGLVFLALSALGLPQPTLVWVKLPRTERTEGD